MEVTAEDCKEHFPTRSFTAAWGQPMAVEQGDWSVVVFQIAVAVLSTNRMYRTRDDWGNVHEFSCFICVCHVCAFYFIECTSSWIIFSLSLALFLSPPGLPCHTPRPRRFTASKRKLLLRPINGLLIRNYNYIVSYIAALQRGERGLAPTHTHA